MNIFTKTKLVLILFALSPSILAAKTIHQVKFKNDILGVLDPAELMLSDSTRNFIQESVVVKVNGAIIERNQTQSMAITNQECIISLSLREGSFDSGSISHFELAGVLKNMLPIAKQLKGIAERIGIIDSKNAIGIGFFIHYTINPSRGCINLSDIALEKIDKWFKKEKYKTLWSVEKGVEIVDL